MTPIQLVEFDSEAALRAHLRVHGDRTVLVGDRRESPRRFYSCVVNSSVGSTTVGLLSSDLGPMPAVVRLSSARDLVGHDTCLTWIRLDERAIVRERRLGGVFFEFIPVEQPDETIVLHPLKLPEHLRGAFDVVSVSTRAT